MNELSVYVHIPFCVSKCRYCDFLSFTSDEELRRDYVRALLKQLEGYESRRDGESVRTVYFGGGTPSVLETGLFEDIMEGIRAKFTLTQGAEISMEINPATVDYMSLKRYRMAGANRISIGLQSADDAELKRLGRIHTFRDFLDTYDLVREAGFTNVNADLISSLPDQRAEGFRKSLKAVCDVNPEHISVYSLIVEEGTPFSEEYRRGSLNLPDEEEDFRIYSLTREYLKERGYGRYEISNYARPGFECVHNRVYWNRGDYLGLGLGAASLIGNRRFSVTSDIDEYISSGGNALSADACLSRKSEMEEFMFLGLRQTDGVRESDFRECFGKDIMEVYGRVIEEQEKDGFLARGEGSVFFTERGLDVSNILLARYLLDEDEDMTGGGRENAGYI